MKKRFFLGASIAFTSLTLAVCVSVFASNGFAKTKNVKADPYTFTVTSADFANSDLTTSYQQLVVHEFAEQPGEEDYTPVLNYSLAKKDGENKLVLAPNGKIYNYEGMAAYHGRVTNILSVTVTYSGSGSLYVRPSIGGEELVFGDRIALSSGVATPLENHPNYVIIQNTAAEVTISSITFTYSCTAVNYSLENLSTTYVGSGADNTAYTLTRDGENVSVAGQNGTIAVTDAGAFTITLAAGNIVYTGTVSSDFKTLNFTGKSGAYASAAPDIEVMNRSYVIDDFEKYASEGTGYVPTSRTDLTSLYTAKGLRAAYYSDYGAGNSKTWVQNSDFGPCTSSDYLLLTTSVAHSGSKAGLFKGSSSAWMRFWTIEAFDQNQHYTFGRGNVVSFFVHSAYTNTSCTTDFTAKDLTIKAVIYYKNFVLTDSNRKSNTGTTSDNSVGFTLKPNSGWNEFRIPADPTKDIYAVNIMIQNNGSSAVYIPIDDITVKTLPTGPSKIAESATRITKSYHGTVSTLGGNITAKIGLGASGYIWGYAGGNMDLTSYSISGDQITINSSGSYGDYTFGTWVGTLSNNNKTITIAKEDISGTIKNVISTSTVVLNEDNVAATGSEVKAVIEGTFMRQTGDSTWGDDQGLDPTSDYYMEGDGAIRIQPNASGRYSLIINPTVAGNIGSIESVAFWLYVPAKMNVALYSYNNANPSGASYKNPSTKDYNGYSQGLEYGWHYINCGLESGYRSNIRITVANGYANALILDYITYF